MKSDIIHTITLVYHSNPFRLQLFAHFTFDLKYWRVEAENNAKNEGPRKPLTSKKMTKSSYLPHITSDPKNKGTLFCSTMKVPENPSQVKK